MEMEVEMKWEWDGKGKEAVGGYQPREGRTLGGRLSVILGRVSRARETSLLASG